MVGYIWLDDIREAPRKYEYVVRNYEDAINLIDYFSKRNISFFISFDHDLGEDKSGYDVAKAIVEKKAPLMGFRIHSANPVGVKNIYDLLTHYGYKYYI